MGPNERWVSVDEVASHVGVRKDSIYRWIEGRGLPARKIGKLWKLKLSEVDAWMRDGGEQRGGTETGRSASEGALGPAAPAGIVLVVDDDESFRETLRDVIADQGYRVLCAADGAEALDLLRSAEGPLPSVIVLDIHMPRMDGLEFLAEQGRDPILAAIPVIVISAERRSDVGAPMLRKPLDMSRLVAAIRGAVGP